MEHNCFTSTLSGKIEYEIRYGGKSDQYVLYIDNQEKLLGTMEEVTNYLNRLRMES